MMGTWSLDGVMKNYALIEFQILPIGCYEYIKIKTKANCTLSISDWKSKLVLFVFYFDIKSITCSIFIYLLIVLLTKFLHTNNNHNNLFRSGDL